MGEVIEEIPIEAYETSPEAQPPRRWLTSAEHQAQRDALAEAAVARGRAERAARIKEGLRPGGTAIFSTPLEPEAVWGDGHRVLMARGESLIVTGPSGVGKTTLTQQLTLGMTGLRDEVLGLPVEPLRRVLYLAADRPRQALRSYRRMVEDGQLEHLDERLMMWEGPLPGYLPDEPSLLLEMAQAADAEVVVIDSLKDVAYNLSSPEIASRYNSARQLCVANGVEVVEIHHQRKSNASNAKPAKLDDVFGGMALVAGSGSVVLVWGEAGDESVEFTHLKQVADRVGPWTLIHDHRTGKTKVKGHVDIVKIIAASPNGLTATSVASTIAGLTPPSRKQVEEARRKLEALREEGECKRRTGARTGGGKAPHIYYVEPF